MGWTLAYVFLAGALVRDFGGHNADKHSHFVCGLVDLVVGPIDSLQRCLGNDIRTTLGKAANQLLKCIVGWLSTPCPSLELPAA